MASGHFPSAIQFHGRWELEEKRYSIWCGASLVFRTTSRSISVTLGELTTSRHRQNQPNVLWLFGSQSEPHTAQVDGKRTLTLTPGPELESENQETSREVTIMLCDYGAILHVLHVEALDGRPILASEARPRMKPMLFIGASLVSGVSPPFRTVLRYGTFQSFAYVAVRTLRDRGLDARLEMVAYPGLRLVSKKNKKGMEDIFWEGMEDLGGWKDRSKQTPEDIFLCLGTNDQGWGEAKDTFLEHYRNLLVRLRDSYKNTGCKRIFVISPFGVFRDMSNIRRTVFEPDVQHMVEALAQSWVDSNPDGTKLYHISTEDWIDKSLTCDGLHPTVKGHEVIGAKLVDYLDTRGFI